MVLISSTLNPNSVLVAAIVFNFPPRLGLNSTCKGVRPSKTLARFEFEKSYEAGQSKGNLPRGYLLLVAHRIWSMVGGAGLSPFRGSAEIIIIFDICV